MKRKTREWEIESVPHDELMDRLDGVRITRRITLRGTAAAAVMLAMGLAGCGEEDRSEDEEDEDNSEKDSGSKSSKSNSDGSSEKSEMDKSEDQKSKTPEQEDDEQSEDESPEDEPEGSTSSSGGDAEDEDSTEPEEDETEEEEEEPGEPISLEEFFDAIMSDAKAAIANSSEDEAEYMKTVDKFLRRLNTDVPKISAGNSFNMRSVAKRGPITVYVMEIRAGAKIPLHNHINHTGNVLGWRGEVKTRNFTKIDGKAKNGGFLLQETDSRTITKGKTGYLARVHNNFHILEAGPQGATLLDVFTYFPNAGSSRYATIGKEPIDKEKKIYEARWSRNMPDLDPRRDFE